MKAKLSDGGVVSMTFRPVMISVFVTVEEVISWSYH